MTKTVQDEKRHYTRIIFNEQNKVRAVVAAPVALPEQRNSLQEISAAVLNMSEGGMQISIERKQVQTMQHDDTVTLSSITGFPEFEALKELSMRVIWIMDNEYLEYILLGMAFFSLSGKQREILHSFVEKRLALVIDKKKKELRVEV